MTETVVKYLRIPKDLWQEIECFYKQGSYRSQVEAIVELIRRGLAVSKQLFGYDPSKCANA